MPLIESDTRATDAEWDAMVDAAPTAIYFQTREWFEIWSEYAGFRIDTRLITFRSGKQVLLPLCHQDFLGGLLKIHFLAPKGMGGFVTNADLDPDEKRELFGLLKKLTPLYGAVNPYDALTNEFDAFNGMDSTQVVDLTEGFEPVFKRWSRGHRDRTTKGLRQGITVELAASEPDWKSYYALYEDNLAHWGGKATNRYGWDLFRLMYGGESGRIKLWLAKYEGQLVCGAIRFYHHKRVVCWHSASAPRFSKRLNAFHVLQHDMIKDACEQGFLLYDLGASSGIGGVIDFKSGFAGQKRQVNVYMSRFMKISDALRRKLRGNAVYRTLMRDTGF
jgi:hypothetical protein